ncbi:unnamed protein product [Spirodela intermedia]|uniref:Laccase n=1 Tax=Spirodela intermedia TaxID=51605 RepID=A0A7I8IEL2_SPIIN|nr:unnamed protein product [Spirodela intermedia]CAA6656226.1 unnamed protein product [Spirodela intermedia]
MDSRLSSKECLLVLVLSCGFLWLPVCCKRHRQVFNIKEAPYTRLCQTKNILTANGEYPGPTLYAHAGDTVIVEVVNRAKSNITLHWHGVKQRRNPWSDGPVYITQCPIKPGSSQTYTIVLSDEEGTVWWHAHNDWARATVHGAFIVYPRRHGKGYPFLKPHKEIPIILGEWWKSDVSKVLEEMVRTGDSPNVSDAFTINGQPGRFYPCSEEGMFEVMVKRGMRYLLRLVNAAMNDELFFAIAQHRLTVVGSDGSYTKPYTSDYITIAPGQTMDLLLEANRPSDGLYYMATKAYSSNSVVGYDNTTATAVIKYSTKRAPLKAYFPFLPAFNDTDALGQCRSPRRRPLRVDHRMVITLSINEFPCANNSCQGPNGSRLAASLNNISFVDPSVDVLGAYYSSIKGVFKKGFPNKPPLVFNFTGDDLPLSLLQPKKGTKVKVLRYNRTVEMVFQGTNLVAPLNHPMHLHGHSFYVVGYGRGNYDKKTAHRGFNLVDPPYMNTVGVPRGGWAAIRFRTDNPGVWFMHCHFDRHTTWGMDTVLIVKNGKRRADQMLPPPANRPSC